MTIPLQDYKAMVHRQMTICMVGGAILAVVSAFFLARGGPHGWLGLSGALFGLWVAVMAWILRVRNDRRVDRLIAEKNGSQSPPGSSA